MNPIIRNIFAVITGLVIGGLINLVLIKISYRVFPVEESNPYNLNELVSEMPNISSKQIIDQSL